MLDETSLSTTETVTSWPRSSFLNAPTSKSKSPPMPDFRMSENLCPTPLSGTVPGLNTCSSSAGSFRITSRSPSTLGTLVASRTSSPGSIESRWTNVAFFPSKTTFSIPTRAACLDAAASPATDDAPAQTNAIGIRATRTNVEEEARIWKPSVIDKETLGNIADSRASHWCTTASTTTSSSSQTPP